MSMNTLELHPHLDWCDKASCSIDEDQHVYHMSEQVETDLGDGAAVHTTLQQTDDDQGTVAYVELTGKEELTIAEVEKLASTLNELAARMRA